MKCSLNWLRDNVDINVSLEELARRLTMAGTEVNSIRIIGGDWENVVVGQLLGIEPHPNADRLRLAAIDIGTEQIKVVCGAPNLRIGDKIAFARIGAYLTDPHTGERAQLKRSKIRGVVSEGMACSEKELGISDNHEKIIILPQEAPLGMPLADYMGDAILDLDVTPNRSDCLSIIGLAREAAALIGQRMNIPSTHYEEHGPEIASLASVEIADPDLCFRYCASLIEGIKIAPSPSWMQQRLIACGMRPINNIVDITNYVMLEYGQPLHAFDFRKIRGNKIIVRRARAGEHLLSLDDVERALNPDMLVIADSQVPVAIAGVMGGAESEVSDATTSVLLESAGFLPLSIRRTSANLKLRSEASFRFERGISPELTVPALKRATQLILQLAGGKAARGIIDVYPGAIEAKPILLHTSQVENLLGMEVKIERIEEVLTSLGFECRREKSSGLSIKVPYWRRDIKEGVDLIEEIARIIGYDAIPTTMLSTRLPRQQSDPLMTLKERLRDLLAGCGFQEAVNYSLTSQERLNRIGLATLPKPLRVANPLSVEQEYLRTSLQPNLLAIFSSNQKQEEKGIRFFEIGKVFIPREKELPEERLMLVGVLSGIRAGHSWLGEAGQLDFFDAKGVVETLLQRIGVEADFEVEKEGNLHPGRAAKIMVDGDKIGVVGELYPEIAERFDLLPQPVALFELEVAKLLLSGGSRRTKYHSLPRFPESVRDVAVVVDEAVPAKKVKDIIRGFPLITSVDLFDLYTGGQIPSGKKSLAFRVVYQSPDRTLTDEEVDKVEAKILKKLSQDLDATLRS